MGITDFAAAENFYPNSLRRHRACGTMRAFQRGVVVQLVRIPACHAGGRGFESRPLRQCIIGNPHGHRLCGFFVSAQLRFWKFAAARAPRIPEDRHRGPRAEGESPESIRLRITLQWRFAGYHPANLFRRRITPQFMPAPTLFFMSLRRAARGDRCGHGACA